MQLYDTVKDNVGVFLEIKIILL